MRENLLGYLLGALDGAEQEAVKRELQRDPQLERELHILESKLVPLECERWHYDPPCGLAEKTCRLILEHARMPCDRAMSSASASRRAALARMGSLDSARAATHSRWSLADLVVAAGICFAAGLFFFPAIAGSRHQARLMVCARNLQLLGFDLAQYSDLHKGYFPFVPATGKLAAAGVFGPTLREAGLLQEPTRLICPASSLAEAPEEFRLPTLSQLQEASEPERLRLLHTAGGSFGYTFGYMVNGRYHAVRNRGRSRFALMADAPSVDLPQRMTDNHGGCGFNVLFEDLHVQYVTRCQIDGGGDDLFRNDYGRIEAGVHSEDSVIGRSAAPPLPLGYGDYR